MITKVNTKCCALCQLSMSSDTTVAEIRHEVNALRQEALDYHAVGSYHKGQRGAFTIISPGEWILEQNLKTCGFKQITKFDRRNGYPLGILKMYFLNW